MPQPVKTFTANGCIRAGTGHSGARDQIAGVDPQRPLLGGRSNGEVGWL